MDSLYPCSSLETEGGAAEKGPQGVQLPAEHTEHVGKTAGASGGVAAALANAGHSLDGAEAELVLNPLRLAFETKNLKLMESALDCLHVCTFFFLVCFLSAVLFK